MYQVDVQENGSMFGLTGKENPIGSKLINMMVYVSMLVYGACKVNLVL